MGDGRTQGEKLFDVTAEVVLYGLCLWIAWYLGGIMRGRFWGAVAVIISGLLFIRGEQCRRETRAAGDYDIDFYIMVPIMCGFTLLLRIWLNPH